MVISVLERRGEIGLRRALGATWLTHLGGSLSGRSRAAHPRQVGAAAEMVTGDPICLPDAAIEDDRTDP